MRTTRAFTLSIESAARSVRPPRDTTACTSGLIADTASAAAAPVLAPNRPMPSCESGWYPRTQRTTSARRSVSSGILKRNDADSGSAAASRGVSRSNSTVANPLRCNSSATRRLRGLSRPLPLPWAKTTTPRAPDGIATSAFSWT
ncbi:MAG: hypothetical protein FJ385_02540 [Verrucomicrobia bacterium]|nr:hypothetical protein [Verrucomicrobiota bacterium]